MSAKLKAAMPIGSTWDATHHAPLRGDGKLGARKVILHRSATMVFTMADGRNSTLDYPKAADITVSDDSRTVTIADDMLSRLGLPLLTYVRLD